MNKNSKQHIFLEMRQKLMQRFLDGELDQLSYERFMADVEILEQAQSSDSSQEDASSKNDARQDENQSKFPKEMSSNIHRVSSRVPQESTGVFPQPAVTMFPISPDGRATAQQIPAMPMVILNTGRTAYPSAGIYGIPSVGMPETGPMDAHSQMPSRSDSSKNFKKSTPSPEITPETIKSLKPGQALDIWWHYPITEECIKEWSELEVPIKLSLAMNPSVTDESVQGLRKVKNIRELNFTSTPITDQGLAFLEGMTSVNSLILTSTQIQGTGADALRSLIHLRELTLTSSPFNDGGMEKLALLSELQILKLDDTRITDDGLEFLTKLSCLRNLNLQGSIISDVGLEYLKNLVTLEKLYVGGTIPYEGSIYESAITNKGIEYLKNLGKMRTLHINDTQLTDTGLKALSDMENLTELNISDTAVTDGSLYYLRNFKNLHTIFVDGTDITISGIRKILGENALRRFHGAHVGTWSKLGSFLKSPWSRKN
ncbi:MAG: hypothetical protein Q4C96_07340 [Planctomycetia bacterium]|nr:hypothetical protein [Planctomycetia bacterium]